MRQFSRHNKLRFGKKCARTLHSALEMLKFGDALIVAGVVLVCLPLLWSARGNIMQAREHAAWQRELTKEASVEQSPQTARRMWTRTRIACEKIDLAAVVVEARHLRDLSRGPMHIPGTGVPGEGNCAIAAHKEKWFRRLAELERGDRLDMVTADACYTYEVTGQKIVTPYDVSVLDATESPTLTLITCTGAPYRHSPDRLIVVAKLVETETTDVVARGQERD